MGIDWVTTFYKASATVFRALPEPVAEALASTSYEVASRLSAERRLLVARHLRRVHGDTLSEAELDRAIRDTFRSYGQYWVDSFRLPGTAPDDLDFNFEFEGLEPMYAALRRGQGTIHVLPHLGGWEWAAFWLARVVGAEVTAVVENIEPPELFDFFARYRESLGVHVVPLGPDAGPAVLRAIKQGHIIALLADRDIEGNGVEVEFFGETTTLPAGPATLALRTGAPILPTAIYFGGPGHRAVMLPPIAAERREKRLRADVQRVTQDIARNLEDLIRRAPEQWHLQQPNWPSDWDALEAIGRSFPRPGEKLPA